MLFVQAASLEIHIFSAIISKPMARHEHDIARPMWLEITNPILPYTREILSVKKGGRIGLIACDAQPSIYDNRVIIESLRHVTRARDARIVALSSEDIDLPGLDELSAEKTIQLHKARSRIFTPHFIIIESFLTDVMYEEQGHEPGISSKEVRVLNSDWGSERFRDTYEQWRDRIEVAKRGFDDMCRSLGGDPHFA